MPELTSSTGAAGAALAWFREHAGDGYDWAGVVRFIIPFLPHRRGQWFCSEACAAALGIAKPHKLTPQALLELVTSVSQSATTTA